MPFVNEPDPREAVSHPVGDNQGVQTTQSSAVATEPVAITIPDGGNPIQGKDGQISLRRILTVLFALAGVGLLFYANFTLPPELKFIDLIRFVPGTLLLVFAMIPIGLLTAQNIKEITAAVSSGKQ